MGWNPERDPHLDPRRNPETRHEYPPRRDSSQDTVRQLGRTAIDGAQERAVAERLGRAALRGAADRQRER